jgi:signal transduction histidine kinase
MRRFIAPEVACRVGRVLAVVSVIAAVAGFPLFVVGGGRLTGGFVLHSLVGVIVLAVPFWAIVRQQPTNLLVWALGWTMLLFAGQILTSGVFTYLVSELFGREAVRDGLVSLPEALPTSLVVLRVIADLIPIPALYLVSFALLVFPDGRLLSPRWRPVVGLFAVGLIGEMTWFGVQSARSTGLSANRADVLPEVEGAFGTVLAVANTLFLVATFLTIVSVVVRYRRSSTVERAQIRWVGAGVAAFAATQLLWFGVVFDPEVARQLFWAASLVTFPALLAGYCVAILRYRLYDIDVVLNRTIVFAILAAFITAFYAAIVVGIGSLIGDASNLALTLGATALVAVVFEPVRARVQHWANRAVYGRRATPYEVLTAIVDDLATAASSDDQLEGMATLLADGTAARHATIWVEAGGTLHAAACWPPHDPGEHGAVTIDVDGPLQVPRSAHVEPVRRDGELLGALSFERGREDPINPHERALLAEMAGQASLLLGNARLRERLRARVDELRSSRRRLVDAQDEARRRIERDLHDGAQQQLVALKVKLGLARTISIKEEADQQTAHAIEDLAAAADVAVESLRTLARGIYPPLLESEGLERALVTQAQRTPIEIDFRAEGLRRYNREVEATVYFCVLEAMRNVVTHANATRLEILLDDRDGRLSFRIVDDGRGFDPAEVVHGLGLTNMGDRIDALGGDLIVEAGVDGGVTVLGSIPVNEPVRDAGSDELALA